MGNHLRTKPQNEAAGRSRLREALSQKGRQGQNAAPERRGVACHRAPKMSPENIPKRKLMVGLRNCLDHPKRAIEGPLYQLPWCATKTALKATGYAFPHDVPEQQ